ncbi:hypothetical protein J6590_064023 [Homalodisca vitripennis]|nr:hypothetical protein J6590_064023 [Homalodisca vitripennis]
MSKRTLDNSLQGESRELMMGRRGMVEKVAHKVVDMLPINEVSVEWDLSKHNQDSSDDSSDDNCWITFL